MSIQIVNAISNRLSLRLPQRDSLEILARVSEIISLEKNGNSTQALETIKTEFKTVDDFERDFPLSLLCNCNRRRQDTIDGRFYQLPLPERGDQAFLRARPEPDDL